MKLRDVSLTALSISYSQSTEIDTGYFVISTAIFQLQLRASLRITVECFQYSSLSLALCCYLLLIPALPPATFILHLAQEDSGGCVSFGNCRTTSDLPSAQKLWRTFDTVMLNNLNFSLVRSNTFGNQQLKLLLKFKKNIIQQFVKNVLSIMSPCSGTPEFNNDDNSK